MKTVVVLVTDENYFQKCKRTILDLRSRGEWTGDVVLITIDFNAPSNFLDFYKITQKRFAHIDCSKILEAYRKSPIRPTSDNREFLKLAQWNKFYVFDIYFSQWEKVIYLDSGLRVFDKIKYLDELNCKGVFMAPDDSPANDTSKRFGGIIETDRNPEVVRLLFQEYDPKILNGRYFLNCIWMYDTDLLKKVNFQELIDAMNNYPICRCNEMTIMNLIFTFKYKLWKSFPQCIETEYGFKRLFGWTENDREWRGETWQDFCFLKYPCTINFECE